MGVSQRYLLSQGPVLRALAGVAIGAVLQRKSGAAPVAPGPWLEAELPPRPVELVEEFVRNSGGDPRAYRGVLPATLFPQWTFPLAARTLRGLPYPLTKVLNAGCRVEQRAPLLANEPLQVRARLLSIDDDGKRALIVQELVTGTASAPDALRCEQRAYVPLARREGGRAAPSLVARGARELGFIKLAPDAGLDFALLTGDFNPIHWLRPAARAAGFRSCILHGFGTLARAVEALNRELLGGDPSKLRNIDARFTKPLPLPSNVGVYLEGTKLWVGDGPGGAAYLDATVEISS